MRKQKEKPVFGATSRVVVWVIAVVLAGAIAVGEVESTQDTPLYAVAEVESTTPPAPSVDEDVMSGEDMNVGSIQSLSFKKDMSIRDALRFLSAKYQKNIVPSTSVDGVVTVSSLYNVSFEEALEAILGHQFKYKQKGNFINVYTAEEYQKIKSDPDRMEQRVFTLYYVNSTEMKKLVRPALSVDAVVEASTAAAVDIEAGQGGDTLAMHDVLVIYDYPENLERVAAIVEEVDVRPPAILIEVTILEAQLKDITEFGIDLSSVAGASITIASTEGVTMSGFASASAGGSSSVSTGLTAAFSIDDITGFLRALESITDTTVLANPKILALNKQAGHILIGSEDGYVTTSQISADGAVQQVEFLESGTKLKFRPYVCKDGYIRMEINPEQSSGSVTVSGNFVLPSKDATTVATNIMVKDGKTIVIGGLFKDDVSQAHSQVPLLGDLPLVGPAFRQIKDTVTRKELIILITPHLVDDPAMYSNGKEIEDVKLVTEGAHKSLNIINRTRIFEDRLKIAEQYYKDGYYEAALAEVENILELRPNFPQASRLRQKILDEIVDVK
jgi:type II secretory pathway component GspD/PulD (secretin)